jgi:uncharacterized protein YjiS (DUF1127 family)
MAYATQSQRAANAATGWQWLGDLRGTLAERFANYKIYRTTLAELENLSDRDLADLGIHRADIRDVAREAVARR